MANIQKGSKIRVIGDTFTADPHGLEIGSIHEVVEVHDSVEWEEFPPLVQFIFAMQGKEGTDLPERYMVRFGPDIENDFANVVAADVEIVEAESKEPFKIRMLEDDFVEGYFEGDEFEAFYSTSEEEYLFFDRDGDARPLDVHAHERV
jgi:hypothetical protein